MNKKKAKKSYVALSWAVACWLALPIITNGVTAADVKTDDVYVMTTFAEEEAKLNPQQVTIITQADIEKKQAKSVEDIIFSETGISRTVDAMGRIGVSIRGAEARHTLILVDGQRVLGDFDKFSGAADEVMRLGTENVERIEVIQGAASAKYGSDAIGGVINVVTKKAGKNPDFQFNFEGSRRRSENSIVPFKTGFLRADSGQLGKWRIGLSASKRDIMPVLATKERRKTGIAHKKEDLERNFDKNVLRFWGDASDLGVYGTYEASKNHTFDFRINRYAEELGRQSKKTDSLLEPIQNFKRHATRDTASLSWNGKAGRTDWTVEGSYARIKEDDVALISFMGRSKYEGRNELRYIDDVDHRQWNVNVTANTQISDSHLLTYGVGYAKESGDGSRLKNAPNTFTRYIDPWDYDKNLLVDKIDRLNRRKGDNSLKVFSHVHDYKFKDTDKIKPEWDMDFEYYGYDEKDTSTYKPSFTYEDYLKYGFNRDDATELKRNWEGIKTPNGIDLSNTPNGLIKFQAYQELDERLKRENPQLAHLPNLVKKYYDGGDPVNKGKAQDKDTPRLNKLKFLEEYQKRNQRITTGRGDIRKTNFFISDSWQVNDDTIIVPILRYDHSSLFGGNLSASLGVTHNIGGDVHRRFKATVGTSYNEPGMGELWYNWEMFSATPINMFEARMGWYWVGNPNLKPEKAINFDIAFEGENKNTSVRANIFHNRIRDYMSVYFTGRYMDFAPFLTDPLQKVQRAPDMIYSFKNIGHAEITGLELEVKHHFKKHWSAKLGYTYLHAVNKSDPLLPRQLLDKPTHKIGIGVQYDNKDTGWSGQLWGDYYVGMLDRNAPSDNLNLYPNVMWDKDGAVYRKIDYKKKTFGVWNLMIQKKFGEDTTAYVGVNNLFNHRDDDRAMQERIYRFGFKFRFGAGEADRVDNVNRAVSEAAVARGLMNFIERPFDDSKAEGVTVSGDYRMRWNNYKGASRPQSSFRHNKSVGDASKNLFDTPDYGFEQRVRVGADIRVGKNTNLRVVGSASGMGGVDTTYDVAAERGFSNLRVDSLDLTQRANKWDFSIGRLHESLGATAYWFGKEYDGARIVWTDKTTQLRIGFGDFRHSTGIEDSPYTHTIHGMIHRAPTVQELLGINRDDFPYDILSAVKSGAAGLTKKSDDPADEDSMSGIYNARYKGKTDKLFFYQQLEEATSLEEKAKIIKRLYDIAKGAYGGEVDKQSFSLEIPTGAMVVYELKHKRTGEQVYKIAPVNYSSHINPWDDKAYKEAMNKRFTVSLQDDAALLKGKQFFETKTDLRVAYNDIAAKCAKENWDLHTNTLETVYTLGNDGKLAGGKETPERSRMATDYDFIGVKGLVTKEGYTYKETNVVDELYHANYENLDVVDPTTYGIPMNKVTYEYLALIEKVLRESENENKLPRESLGNIVGNIIEVEGTVLERDRIPSIHRAVFIQGKKQISQNLGVVAWAFKSVGDEAQAFSHENGQKNDVYSFKELAKVIGIGGQYQIGEKAKLSFDYGRNYTAFARHMNGSSVYEHERGTADFTLRGHKAGETPSFWVARLDVGNADTKQAGSWNAFVDYKHFEHGAFFGGNGTEGVPDRYLDGIESFTVGLGYVPAKDFLLEAFYTFEAKGINTRDTVNGPESFRLGNYTRVQGTYKF